MDAYPFQNYRDFPKATQQFIAMLKQCPFAVPFWSVTKGGSLEVNIEQARAARLPEAEAAMLAFLVAVWTGENALAFDPFEAVRSLPEQHRQLIADWLKSPFWP